MSLILNRRAFLGASAVSLAATGFLRGEEVTESTTAKASGDDPTFDPSTLFLSWQRDPTTTMTVQWVGTRGETPDTKVYFATSAAAVAAAKAAASKPADSAAKDSAKEGEKGSAPAAASVWSPLESINKPFGANSDLKVFRAELTGLKPNTDYQFKI